MSCLQITNLDYVQSVSSDRSVKGGLLIPGIDPLNDFMLGFLLPTAPLQLTSIGSSSTALSISTDPGVSSLAIAAASVTSQGGLISSVSLFAAVS
jgi:hypothetical protein